MPMPFRLDRCPSPIGTILLISDDDGDVRALDFEDYEVAHAPVAATAMGRLRDFGGTRARDARNGRSKPISRVNSIACGRCRSGWAARRSNVTFGMRYGPFRRAPRRVMGGSRPIWAARRPVARSAWRTARTRSRIVVPCHRVIGSDGSLTGYGGGLPRKQWLIRHEREYVGRCYSGVLPGGCARKRGKGRAQPNRLSRQNQPKSNSRFAPVNLGVLIARRNNRC